MDSPAYRTRNVETGDGANCRDPPAETWRARRGSGRRRWPCGGRIVCRTVSWRDLVRRPARPWRPATAEPPTPCALPDPQVWAVHRAQSPTGDTRIVTDRRGTARRRLTSNTPSQGLFGDRDSRCGLGPGAEYPVGSSRHAASSPALVSGYAPLLLITANCCCSYSLLRAHASYMPCRRVPLARVQVRFRSASPDGSPAILRPAP